MGQQPGAQTEGRTIPLARQGRDDHLAARLGGPLEQEVDQASTNTGSVPGGRHPHERQAEPLGGLGGLGVEVVHDLHVVGDEADRGAARRRDPPSAASSSSRSLTSGSSHGWVGGPEREQKTSSAQGQLRSRARVHLVGEAARQAHVLVGVEVAVAVAGPGRVVHRVGDRVRDEEQVGRIAGSAAATRAPPRRRRSVLGATKPGWMA